MRGNASAMFTSRGVREGNEHGEQQQKPSLAFSFTCIVVPVVAVLDTCPVQVHLHEEVDPLISAKFRQATHKKHQDQAPKRVRTDN